MRSRPYGAPRPAAYQEFDVGTLHRGWHLRQKNKMKLSVDAIKAYRGSGDIAPFIIDSD